MTERKPRKAAEPRLFKTNPMAYALAFGQYQAKRMPGRPATSRKAKAVRKALQAVLAEVGR